MRVYTRDDAYPKDPIERIRRFNAAQAEVDAAVEALDAAQKRLHQAQNDVNYWKQSLCVLVSPSVPTKVFTLEGGKVLIIHQEDEALLVDIVKPVVLDEEPDIDGV